jgi:group I intron endonuclease
MAEMFIYKISNTINNKVYVGQTKKVFHSRMNSHKCLLRNNKHYNKHLQLAWNKYGEASFTFEVIEQLDPEMNFDLSNLERYWIKFYDSMNPEKGYNLTEGGEGCLGRKMSKTHFEKLRIRNLGTKRSEQTKKLLSEIRTGKSHKCLYKSVVDSLGNVFESIKAAAKFYNAQPDSVSMVLTGKRKKLFGISFKYI